MTVQNAEAPPLIVEREAARRLRVSPKTLWTLRKAGQIPFVAVGRSIRYRVETLDAWIAERERESVRRG